jgi:succinate dehydrogenase/fumarate reductase flavoprotein subunit
VELGTQGFAIIVIAGGHAGTEATVAAAQPGGRVAWLTSAPAVRPAGLQNLLLEVERWPRG